jgi:hypothetical protein
MYAKDGITILGRRPHPPAKMNEISPIDQLEAIIKDIEKTVRNFSISGPGVSGHIKDGYLVNAPPGIGQSGEGTGGAAPPPPPTGVVVTFSGQSKCCFNGNSYKLFPSLDGSVSVPQVGTNHWRFTDPAYWTVSFYASADCDTGSFVTSSYAGGIDVVFSGGMWTVQEWVTIGGTDFDDFNGTDATETIPNSLAGCGGSNSASGGAATIT